jgi:hypothetical protein
MKLLNRKYGKLVCKYQSRRKACHSSHVMPQVSSLVTNSIDLKILLITDEEYVDKDGCLWDVNNYSIFRCLILVAIY